jgi:hypothetical protein
MIMISACENTRKHRLIHHAWECDYFIQHQHRQFVYAFILGTTDSTVCHPANRIASILFAVQKLECIPTENSYLEVKAFKGR